MRHSVLFKDGHLHLVISHGFSYKGDKIVFWRRTDGGWNMAVDWVVRDKVVAIVSRYVTNGPLMKRGSARADVTLFA